jgi:hypothetical protein
MVSRGVGVFVFFGLELFQGFDVHGVWLTVSPANLPFEGCSHDRALYARAIHFGDVDERTLAIPAIRLQESVPLVC